MYNLFTKFPVVTYNSSLAVNILAKVKLTDLARTSSTVFFPYTVRDGERADNIAADYYDDPRYSWVIYMINDIVDPYYDWVMTESEFREYIIKKYGSLENSFREIAYWEDNWYGDDSILSVSQYNALPAASKKYFKPEYSQSSVATSYIRNQLDLAVETNCTIEITLSSVTGLNIGDYITQYTSGTLTASGFIKGISYNTIVVQNVHGAFAKTAGNVGNVQSEDNNISISATAAVLINRDIPTAEQAYWTHVTKYDYENNLNEQKRFIRLIDKSFIDQIEKELDSIL